jgi:outer membrane lipase/esterase
MANDNIGKKSTGCLTKSFLGWLLAVVLQILPSTAYAGYSSLYVFGDSLSDSGNNAIVLAPNVTPVPISGNSFIPTYPYASGTYSNGLIWAQTLASMLGLSANPSLLGGTDYAFGGAQTGSGLSPPGLETQAALFLSAQGGIAPGNALYVVEGGGEDVLHALAAIPGCGGNPVCVNAIIGSTVASFAGNIDDIVLQLEQAEASNIVVWNVPDLGDAPALRALGASPLGTMIASSMNGALLNAIGGDPDVKLFDAFGLLDDVVANPSAFGLSNVTDACAQFISCDAAQYLFWDGIHPTSAVDPIIGDAILALVGEVPEPSTFILLGIALTALGFARRRQIGGSVSRGSQYHPRVRLPVWAGGDGH